MTIVRVQKVIWDKYNTEHIKKHGVSITEVETLVKSDVYIKDGYLGKKILINKIGSRLLAVVGKMKGNKIYVVTARDASDKERQGYYEFKENKKN